MSIVEYLHTCFDNKVVVFLGAIWACIGNFLFPTEAVQAAAIAVLIIMILDLLTRLFAEARKAGGYKKAVLLHGISSEKFAKGTLDKLIVFGVVLVLCGCAYKLTLIDDVAKWFSQVVFCIMFLRDSLSIFENLMDAGVEGLKPFKSVLTKKLEDVTDLTDTDLASDNTVDQPPSVPASTETTVVNNSGDGAPV